MRRVAVIGGGIAGLTAAYRLKQSSHDVRIFERSDRCGGKIRSHLADGYVMEAAADCFISRKPDGIALCEALGIADDLIGRRLEFARTYIKLDGDLHDLPEGLTGMVPGDLEALASSSLLSATGQQRARREPEQPVQGSGEESIAAFISRRFGREVYERVVEPLMSGIYAGDGEQMSLQATFPRLRELEQAHGSVVLGLAHAGGGPGKYPPFVSFENGMQHLTDALVARFNQAEIRSSCEVQSLRTSNDGYIVTIDGDVEVFDAAVVALPPAAASRVLHALDSDASRALVAMPAASSVLVTLAFDAFPSRAPLDGYGYLIPAIAGGDIIGVTFSSNKWAARAPGGRLLARVYLGRHGGRDVTALDDATLVHSARDELASCGVTALPLLERIQRWPGGLPQYTIGHQQRVRDIENALAAHGAIFISGGAYHGVGIPDCISSGNRAAAKVNEYLTKEPHATR